MKPLYEQIKTLAAQKNLDMKSLLSVNGVNNSTWWRWKNGKSSPSEKTFVKLMNYLEDQK